MSLYFGPGWIDPRRETMPTKPVTGVKIVDGKIEKKPPRMRAGQTRAKIEAKATKEAAAWAGKSKGKP